MEFLYWSIIIIMIAIAFIGLFYPIIPGVLFLFGAFFLYGLFFSFSAFHWFFWIVQILFAVLLFFADSLSNVIGIKRFGGSKAAVWGSTIGLLAGPFVIPAAGIIIGPFLGAVAGELLVNRCSLLKALKIGAGSLIGFLTSIAAKGIIQMMMTVYFFITVLS